MIGVYIVGEDDVTRHVIYRILSYCGAGRFTVLMELPARGGEIKNKIPNLQNISLSMSISYLVPDCRNKEEQKPVWKCSLVVSLLIF